MSSDEEEVLTGRQKRSASLAKRGRNRISTLADDDDYDDGVFENAEEGGSEDESQAYKEVDATFSASNLKKALQKLKLKGCIHPELDDSFEAKTWKDMEKEIREKGINLQEVETLVKYLNKADNLTLEYKCLVICIARQTCVAAKIKSDTKKAQELFKSKDKSNKTNHVANFVSNTWFWESLGHLQKIGALADSSTGNNMHIVLIECSLQFMRDSYVIDSEKKMSVLKEKQQIDWMKAVQKAMKLAIANKITTMSAEATLTRNHFQGFKEGNKPPDPATGGKTDEPSNPATVETTSVQDMAKKKRTERLQNLRRRVSATSLQNSAATGSASAPAPSSSVNQQSQHISRAPDMVSKPDASRTSSSPGTHASRNENETGSNPSSWASNRRADSRPSWGQQPRDGRQRGWGGSSSQAPAPAPSAPVPSRDSGPRDIPPRDIPPRDDPPRDPQPRDIPHRDVPPRDSAPSEIPPRDFAPVDSASGGAGRGDPSSVPAPVPAPGPSNRAYSDMLQGSIRSTDSWGRAPAPSPAPARGWEGDEQTSGHQSWDRDYRASSYSSIVDSEHRSSWNDSDAPHNAEGYSDRRSRGSSAGYDQRSYPPHDSYSSGSGRSDREQTNSTSVVSDSGPADARGRTWGDSAPSSAAYSAGSAYDNQTDGSAGYEQSRSYSSNEYSSSRNNYGDGRDSYNKRSRDFDTGHRPERNGDKRQRYENPPPNRDAFQNDGATGRGRGRGRTLPAWMTQSDGQPPPTDDPSTSQMGAQRNSDYASMEMRRDPQPERSYPQSDAPVAIQGNGRGRGRTLPAWMTQNGSDGPQSQPSASPPRGHPDPYEDSRNEPYHGGGFPQRDAPAALQGTGRGRGRTLPAWMTQQR